MSSISAVRDCAGALVGLPAYVERDRPRVDFRNRVLAVVTDYQAEHRRSPSHKEIAAAVGIRTEPAVWRTLRLLEDEGRIRRCRTQITLLQPS